MFDDDENDGQGLDPYQTDGLVSKAYDRQIFLHQEFETVCAKYWQLLRNQPTANRTSDVITKDQYTQLMKRVYKVLLPLYREAEMTREVAQEWIFDARSQETMNLTMFQKMLFRIAHSWATHIDIDEYVELLNKVYARITMKKVIRGDSGKVEMALPRIQVEIFQPKDDEDAAEWQSCLSDEYQDDNYEYMHKEDPIDPSQTKRYKRPLPDANNEEDGGVLMTVRDPFLFNEEVQYFREQRPGDFDGVVSAPSEKDVIVDLLADMDDVQPMGYPTEQFICKLKNDVIQAFIKLKEDRRKAVADMRRQMFEDGAKIKVEKAPEIMRDPGLLDAQGFIHEDFFQMMNSLKPVKIATLLRVEDKIYNQMRTLFKENSEIVIRPYFSNPSAKILKETAPVKITGSHDPATQINENFYNPALERRLIYKTITCEMGEMTKNYCLNVNYLIEDPVYETAFRSDVNRIETSKKMSIKPPQEGEIVQSHEFCNVTTSFQETMKIMLSSKFQFFWTAKVSDKQQPLDKQRDQKMYEAERQRKQAVLLKDSLTSKNLTENFDEKNYMKLMRGPFYNLISREGSREDDFVNCTTRDLIDSANSELIKVLILGKPRSGKTTLAKALAQRLDLVRVSPEVWLEDLFARIKEREENPPEEDEEDAEEAKQEPAKDEGEPELDQDGNPIPKPDKVVEAPREPEEPKRDKKDLWLTDLEYDVRNTLREGQAISLTQIDEIIRLMVNSDSAQTKGFVMDLTFSRNEEEIQWGTRLIEGEILVDSNELTHIIELSADDEEVKRRSSSLMIKPHSGIVFSKWERTERNKPKPVKLDADGQPIEEEEEEPENLEELIAAGLKGPLKETEMVARICDSEAFFGREIEYYNMRERNIFDELIVKLFESTYIRVDIAGLTPIELTDTVLIKMKPIAAEPLRPIAKIIEDGAGDFKSLLTQGFDEEEGFFVPRQWSLWKTYDPVSLKRGQVEQGLPEFAAHFGNNVFVFKNEENLKEFVKRPRLYIEKAPEMPQNFRILMTGPRGIGVRTQASLLQDLYGWRVVDFKRIVQEKLKDILSQPVKLPNNVTQDGPCMISMSEHELQDIKDGKPIPSWKFLPWVMEFLEIPLRIKDPPPPEEDSSTDNEWDEARLKAHKEKQKKKKKEQEAAVKAAAEAAAAKADRAAKRREAIDQGLNLEDLGLQDSEEERIIEDVSIDQLILCENEDGSLPTVDRFILIGFPQTETHCSKLKQFNIDFDRVIFLSEEAGEGEDDEPGKQVSKRMTEADGSAYDWAAELEIANALMATLKEYLGEEGEKKIMEMKDCSGKINEVHFKIRSRLDPFFTRPEDTTDDIRTSADYEEEEIHRMPKCDFGDYCPVTFVDEGFLVKGGSDEDGGDPNELYVNGKRYFFAGSKELNKFKKSPSKYMIVREQGVSIPIQPPAPKIMITGNKCAGVTSQINMLCERFKLEPLELLSVFQKKQAEELKSRQRKRLLARGFKGIPENDDPDAEPEVDTEIMDDPEDFDKDAQNVSDLKSVVHSNKGLVIDGNWRVGGDEPSYDIPDLLKNARRMPEIVVILKCKEEVSIKRSLADSADEMKAEFERKTNERQANKVKARQDARNEKIAELDAAEYEDMSPADIEAKKNDEIQAWDEARDEQEREEDENDEEKPDLEKMKEEKAEALKAIYEADETNLETLKTKLIEDWKAVQVIELDTSKISAEFVHIKLLDLLKNHIKYRKDLIERAQAVPIKPKEVAVYEQSYTYKQSKFGEYSPISLFNPTRTKNHAVLYRERIYYLSDTEEQSRFLLEPSQYVLGVESIPLDISIIPRVVVQGLPKSGKSTLCKRVSEITGAVHLEMETLIEGFVDRDSSFAAKVSHKLKVEGRDLDDLLLVQLIQKRVGMADCTSRGWVLEGFPQTRSQAILMAKKSLLPSNVIIVDIPIEEVYKRTQALIKDEFGCDRTILKRRLDITCKNTPQMVYFFQKYYNNVTSIDGLKSKWFLEDVAVRAISDHLKAKMCFARDYQYTGQPQERPCMIANLNMDRTYFKQSLSQFGYFCPVSWKNSKSFVKCTHMPELSVLYKNLFYYFANAQQRDLFIRNPRKFTENVIFSSDRNIPRRMMVHKASEISETDKALLNYCPVTLLDQEKLVRGNPLLVVKFKGDQFSFCSEEKLSKFIAQVSRYSKVKLPVKIPPEEKPVPLYNLQKEENSVTFLEQALGSVVTKGLREIGEQRLKYPTLTVKETMLKLFAIFLKTENPANTENMREKYMNKMKSFLEKCCVPEELNELAEEKKLKKKKNQWPQFKENYYNTLGQQYDKILHDVEKEKADGFWGYMK